MSEEFRAGDTYQNKGEHARAGIDSFGWGNRIEVYGVTPSEAEELRDRILAALKDRDVVLEELLREAREQLNDTSALTSNLEWKADLGKLVDRIDAALKERV